MLVSGFFEPLFYLLSIGVGLGQLVGNVTRPAGQQVTYTAFVAPALLATSAMNGAIFDSTFNVFFRLKYAKLYDAALATPMRAGRHRARRDRLGADPRRLYAVAFLVVMLAMGLVHSRWAVLALPAAVLIGFAFAGRRDGRHHVHAQLAGLRVRDAGRACRCSCSPPRSTR